jgi:hypothetical protein
VHQPVSGSHVQKDDLQLPAFNHIRDQQYETMPTKANEDSGLIINPPHLFRDILGQILPSLFACGLRFLAVLLESVRTKLGEGNM